MCKCLDDDDDLMPKKRAQYILKDVKTTVKRAEEDEVSYASVGQLF